MDSRRKFVARVHTPRPTLKAAGILMLAAFLLSGCMPRPLSVVRVKDEPLRRRQVIIECSDVDRIYATEARLGAYGVQRTPFSIRRSQIAGLELAGQRSMELGLYAGLGALIGGLALGYGAGLANDSVGSYEVPGLVFGSVLGLSLGLPHFIGGYRMKARTRRKAQWRVGADQLTSQENCRWSGTEAGAIAPPNDE